MIFKKGRKRGSESPLEDATDDEEEIAEAPDDEADSSAHAESADLAALEEVDAHRVLAPVAEEPEGEAPKDFRVEHLLPLVLSDTCRNHRPVQCVA